MNYCGIVIHTHLGEIDIVQPSDPKEGFSLEELQGIVGGYIDIVPLWPGWVMVVNDEGLLKDLPLNVVASMLRLPQRYLCGLGAIVGDVLVCPSKLVK